MQTRHLPHLLTCMGPNHKLVYATFTPNGTSDPTVAESHGVTSVTYSNTGVYVLSLSDLVCNAITVLELSQVLGDTNMHQLEAAVSTSAKTVTVTHKTVAWASIASGPAASNTSGAITVALLVRVAS